MSQAHLNSKLALSDILVPIDSDSSLFHFDTTLNSTQGIKPTFSKIRYIRDYINGSTVNTGNHWVEIQVYDANGVNIALGKGSGVVTDGSINTTNYYSLGAGLQYTSVDLGGCYEVSYIKIWHYYGDGRTYHSNKTMVSNKTGGDSDHWITVFDSDNDGEYQETVLGHLIDLTKARYLYANGKYDGCLGIFESTANMLYNPYFTSSLGSYYSVRGSVYTISIDTTNKYHSINSLKIVGTSSGAVGTDVSITTKLSCTLSTQYTVSFYAKALQSTSFSARWGYGDSSTTIVSTGWAKYSITISAGTQAYNGIFLYFNSATTVWINSIQLEQKIFATDTVLSSRSNNDFLEYPLNISPSTVSCWVKSVVGDNRLDVKRVILRQQADISSTYWELYFSSNTTTTEQNNLILHIAYPNPDDQVTLEHRYCICYNGSSVNLPKKDLCDGNWHFINFWFDASYAYLIVDNLAPIQSKDSLNIISPFRVSPLNFDSLILGIGCSYDYSVRPANIYIDELRLDNKVYNTLSNYDEANSWLVSNKPYYDPYDYSIEVF